MICIALSISLPPGGGGLLPSFGGLFSLGGGGLLPSFGGLLSLGGGFSGFSGELIGVSSGIGSTEV